MALPHAVEAGDGREPALSRTTVLFPTGLIGCSTWRRFLLVREPGVSDICLIQSLDEPSVSLLLMRAAAIEPRFVEDLQPEDQAALAALGVGVDPAVEIYCTVTLHDSGQVTANLVGPSVIDFRRASGTQLVLVSSPWSIRHVVTSVTD